MHAIGFCKANEGWNDENGIEDEPCSAQPGLLRGMSVTAQFGGSFSPMSSLRPHDCNTLLLREDHNSLRVRMRVDEVCPILHLNRISQG